MNKLNKFHPKIMSTAFSKWLKRLIIAGLCVALVGGAASAFLLQPQIQEGIQAAQTWSTQEREWRQDAETNGWGRWNRDAETDDWKSRWYGDFGGRAEEHFAISEPSTEAKIAVFATGVLWLLLGVVWNLAAAVLFLVVCRFIREKCPDCGHWQKKGDSYCGNCGAAVQKTCSQCGAAFPISSRYCPSCGGACSAGETAHGNA